MGPLLVSGRRSDSSLFVTTLKKWRFPFVSVITLANEYNKICNANPENQELISILLHIYHNRIHEKKLKIENILAENVSENCAFSI